MVLGVCFLTILFTKPRFSFEECLKKEETCEKEAGGEEESYSQKGIDSIYSKWSATALAHKGPPDYRSRNLLWRREAPRAPSRARGILDKSSN